MKIIRLGVLPSEKIYNSICPNCSCVFEFTESEGKVLTEMYGKIVVVDCPFCLKQMVEGWKPA
jgi:hypothetical protein